MTIDEARKILGSAIQLDNSIHTLSEYSSWHKFNKTITLDGEFPAEVLEAFAFWMREFGEE